ncbi:MAG: VanZ family protein [Bryobacteraceae bacterium]
MRSWWVAVAVWIGIIFLSSTSAASRWCEAGFSFLSGIFMSSLPTDSTSFGVIHLAADKGLHLTLFAILAGLLFQAMASPRRRVLRILSFGFIVGCCSEYLQSFFPDRDPAIRDVFINLAGTGIGLLLTRILWRKDGIAASSASREYTCSRSDAQ